MSIQIGSSTGDIIVYDNATIASGNYWELKGATVRRIEPRGAIVTSQTLTETSIKKKEFATDNLKYIITYEINNYTDYDKHLDLLDTWDSSDTRLYLQVKNDWGSNLATKGTKASPATQGIFRGKIFNYSHTVYASRVAGRFELHYTSK